MQSQNKTRKVSNSKQTSKPSLDDLTNTYTTADYNSNDGMLTCVWGPCMWHYLHTMSFNYPVHPTKKDKIHYREFMLGLQHILPCGKCRTNLCANYKKLPLKMKHMKNRATFSRYVYDLHELINTMLEKKSGLTYEMVRERYEHFRARCTISAKNTKKHAKTKKRVRFANIPQTTKESGCVEPLYGEKSKCVLQIVPYDTKCDSLSIDKECIKHKNIVKSSLHKHENATK